MTSKAKTDIKQIPNSKVNNKLTNRDQATIKWLVNGASALRACNKYTNEVDEHVHAAFFSLSVRGGVIDLADFEYLNNAFAEVQA